MAGRTRVWDPLVRVFHWALVTGFFLNAFITDPEKDLHEWIGYTILGLVTVRILWGFIGSRHARFADFPPSPVASIKQLGEMFSKPKTIHVGHTPLGALMIYNLLLTMLAIGVTGWMQTTNMWFGIEWVEETHEALATWAEICVVLHIAAVLFESRRTGVNLPKAMITGFKELP